MSNNNNITFYNVEHIKKYVSGNMSREEMYVFEKALLNDSFLEDAVEGFKAANIAKATTDLAAIKAQLLTEKKQAKIILFYRQYKAVLNVAAMVILIVGIGAITYSIFNTSSPKNLATVTIPKKEITIANADTARIVAQENTLKSNLIGNKSRAKNEASNYKKEDVLDDNSKVKGDSKIANLDAPIIVKKDSIKRDLNGSYEPKQITVTELKNLQPVSIEQALQGRVAGVEMMKKEKAKITIRGNSSLAKNQQPLYIIDGVPKDSLPTSINAGNIANIEVLKDKASSSVYGSRGANGVVLITTKKNKITGKIINQKQEPIANASIVINNTNKGIVTDTLGNFSLNVNDSLANITVSSVGYNSVTASISNKNSNQIILNEANDNLNEVVVVGYGLAHKKNITGSITSIKDKNATPVGGWDAFNMYFKKQLAAAIDPATHQALVLKDQFGNMIDTLTIQLFVNKKQEAYKIKTLNIINKSANTIITTILKNGPKWITPKRKNKVQIALKIP